MHPPLPAVLSRVATKGNPPGPISRWVIGTRYLCTLEYYSVLKKEILPLVTVHESVGHYLREINEVQKDSYFITFMYGIWKPKKQGTECWMPGAGGKGWGPWAPKLQLGSLSEFWESLYNMVAVINNGESCTWALLWEQIFSLLAGKIKDNNVELWTWQLTCLWPSFYSRYIW